MKRERKREQEPKKSSLTVAVVVVIYEQNRSNANATTVKESVVGAKNEEKLTKKKPKIGTPQFNEYLCKWEFRELSDGIWHLVLLTIHSPYLLFHNAMLARALHYRYG